MKNYRIEITKEQVALLKKIKNLCTIKTFAEKTSITVFSNFIDSIEKHIKKSDRKKKYGKKDRQVRISDKGSTGKNH